MNLDHVTAFTAAMQHKNLEAMFSHMADDAVLNTPLIAEPIKGKAAIRQIVEPLLAVVDAFDFREIMHGPEHVSSFFKVTVGTTQLDGMDYWLLDKRRADQGDDGLVAASCGGHGCAGQIARRLGRLKTF